MQGPVIRIHRKHNHRTCVESRDPRAPGPRPWNCRWIGCVCPWVQPLPVGDGGWGSVSLQTTMSSEYFPGGLGCSLSGLQDGHTVSRWPHLTPAPGGGSQVFSPVVQASPASPAPWPTLLWHSPPLTPVPGTPQLYPAHRALGDNLSREQSLPVTLGKQSPSG